MPAVNPTVIVLGTYLIREPNLNKPIITNIIPAIITAVINPSNPCSAIIEYIIVTNAAVGPPI